ncbi:MAG: redox-regulated ATPase YchF [Candidatus Omnitrophica bacterium]|nr:redox-regulated ATPase YchF [Candidatus Omnitrophota bacterium]
MKIAVCGLPFSGKSTVFKALVGKETQARTSGSGKIQLNLGTLEVRDRRLEELGRILNSEKITYPKISLVDVAHSAQVSKKMDTSHIKEFDALLLIIGAFASKTPLEDLKNIESELILTDLQVLQNRIERINKERKGKPKKEEDPELLLLERLIKALEQETILKNLALSREEFKMLSGFQLLTLKPAIVIVNISEEQLNKGPIKEVEEEAKRKNLKLLSLCAKLEAEIEELAEEERSEFMQEMGLASLSEDKFIEICFQALNLISFFTVVGKEARAWPVACGTTALEAAGCIHSDMEKGFIRAEVINYKDFMECGSFAKAKEKGLLRLESKEYPVQDGDIINFKFSV